MTQSLAEFSLAPGDMKVRIRAVRIDCSFLIEPRANTKTSPVFQARAMSGDLDSNRSHGAFMPSVNPAPDGKSVKAEMEGRRGLSWMFSKLLLRESFPPTLRLMSKAAY